MTAHQQAPRRVKKSGVKHTPTASAVARAYNGGLGGTEPLAGIQGTEPPVEVLGQGPPLKPTRFWCLKQSFSMHLLQFCTK